MMLARWAVGAVCIVAGTTIAATPAARAESGRDVAERVRDWRSGHERQVLSELMGLLEIPNVAADRENIRRNAEMLVAMLERRGARAEILENEPGPAAVLGEIRTPGAKRTVVFYAHYDGGSAGSGRAARDGPFARLGGWSLPSEPGTLTPPVGA